MAGAGAAEALPQPSLLVAHEVVVAATGLVSQAERFQPGALLLLLVEALVVLAVVVHESCVTDGMLALAVEAMEALDPIDQPVLALEVVLNSPSNALVVLLVADAVAVVLVVVADAAPRFKLPVRNESESSPLLF